MNLGIDLSYLLLALMVIFGVWAVMTASLMKAAIGLALCSIALAALMYQLLSPLAAVFELSVCAGLITVVFMSAISMTENLTKEEQVVLARKRVKRFILLPVLLLIVGGILAGFSFHYDFTALASSVGPDTSVRDILWNRRGFDIFGQIIIILVGVFGVVVLFKEKARNNHGKRG